MKKYIILGIALLMLTPLAIVRASSVPSAVSIEDLVKYPDAFDGKFVALQGFLTIEQEFSKPAAHYLRDNMGNMIKLKLSMRTDVSNYAGKKVDVTGAFVMNNEGMQLEVAELTPLEEPEARAQPVVGAANTIVIMAYFTDRANTVNQGGVYRMVFDEMNGFYMEASYDGMYVTGGWYPWVKLGHTVQYYGQTNPSWWFIRDAVAAVDNFVNFAPYTYFLFVDAGPNEESSGNPPDIWSARWSGLNIATNDGVTITHGAIVPDIEANPYGALGVTCHEYAHELGLPDLYTYPSNVLQYDLMDSGSWNDLGKTPSTFISWCRMQQNWIPNQRIRSIPYGTAELLMLDPLEDPTATISVIAMYEIEYDYYLIEARRQVGFDTYIPSEKVLVLHVDGGLPYLVATLGVGQAYRTPDIEVQVLKEDLDNWCFQVYVSHKYWSANTRLTNDAGASEANWRGQAVASVGSYVYAVWDETRDGNWEIYYKRSTDNGATWSADTRLTNDAASSWYPSVAAYGSYVYIVWQEYRNGNWEIYLKRSENYGASWPYADQRLTNNAASSLRPSVAAYARNVHVAWHDDRPGNYEIYYKRSTDNGFSWGADSRKTNNAGASEYAYVAAYRNYVYIAYQDNTPGNYEIYVKRSTDNGATWVTSRLTTQAADQMYSSVAAYGKFVHVVWTDYRNVGNAEIYYRRSVNYGVAWKPETRLTNNVGDSVFASVAVKGRTVYVVWEDFKTGQWEIFFKDSPDNGVHWTADRILSDQPNVSQWPSISVSGDNVYVVWTDQRNGNNEIYFISRW